MKKLAAMTLVLTSYAAAQAATVTLYANKDTSLNNPSLTGSETTLTAKPGQPLLTGFDLSSIPVGSVIQQVQLKLYFSEFTDSGGISYFLSSLIAPNESWSESSTSLGFAPSTLTTFIGGSSLGGYMVFTGEAGSGFLAATQLYVDNPTQNYGFGFDYKIPESNPGFYEELNFYSREGGLALNRAPELTITYIPEPASWIMAIFGSAIFFCRKR